MTVTTFARGALAIMGFGSLSFFSGCALYLATPLDAEPAHTRAYRKEVHGLVLAADLVNQPPVTKALFYRPLNEEGIVPVILHFENQGSRTVVFRRDSIGWL